jgi:hypothetical protein
VWCIKERKIEPLASCSLIVMKYILKYGCIINPQKYRNERTEDEDLVLI